MTLERNDLRVKLDADTHSGSSLLANASGRGMAEIVEGLVKDYVTGRIHEAMVVAEQARAGDRMESPGKAGNGRGVAGDR